MLDVVQSVDPVARIAARRARIMLETSSWSGSSCPATRSCSSRARAVDRPAQYVALLSPSSSARSSGESIGFALGRFFGPRIRALAAGPTLGERNWVRAENYLDRRGGIAVFVSRFLPVLHSLVPLTVGMSTMSYRRFIAWTAPACIIWALAYVTVGTVAAGGFRDLADRLHYAGYLFVGGSIVFFVGGPRREEAARAPRGTALGDDPGDGDATRARSPDAPLNATRAPRRREAPRPAATGVIGI